MQCQHCLDVIIMGVTSISKLGVGQRGGKGNEHYSHHSPDRDTDSNFFNSLTALLYNLYASENRCGRSRIIERESRGGVREREYRSPRREIYQIHSPCATDGYRMTGWWRLFIQKESRESYCFIHWLLSSCCGCKTKHKLGYFILFYFI